MYLAWTSEIWNDTNYETLLKIKKLTFLSDKIIWAVYTAWIYSIFYVIFIMAYDYNIQGITSYLKYYVLDYKCVVRRKKIVCNWRQRVDTIVWSIYCLNGYIYELSTTQWKTIGRLVYMGFFSFMTTTHYFWPFLKPSPTKAL